MMKKNELEQIRIWTKVLNRAQDLRSMAIKEKDPVKAGLQKRKAEILSKECSAHGRVQQGREMTEEQLKESISYAKKLLAELG